MLCWTMTRITDKSEFCANLHKIPLQVGCDSLPCMDDGERFLGSFVELESLQVSNRALGNGKTRDKTAVADLTNMTIR